MLLGIDVGTTHCKAGVFDERGRALGAATRPTRTHRHESGYFYFEPEELWQGVSAAVAEAMSGAAMNALAGIGIASMAESGLLVERATGTARTPFIPWFDRSAQPQAEFIRAQADARERFSKTGIHPTFKCSLAKLLWLRENGTALADAVWLGAAEYIAYRLTGKMASEHSLATRTGAFRLDTREWDVEWLDRFGLSWDVFPPVQPSTVPVGQHDSVEVFIAGHDHVCAALAVGAIKPGVVFDSMGTAEALFGTRMEAGLGDQEFESGLVFGCHVIPGAYYWMGGLSSSGGSVEWLRAVMSDPPLTYAAVDALLSQARAGPTRILYYPYLSGGSSPHADPRARAALLGLDATHSQADILKAVLEGTAFEMEAIRQSAEPVRGAPIDELIVAGGGTRLRPWMQIKADVSNCRLRLSSMSEGTTLGAAMVAAIGVGLFAGAEAAVRAMSPPLGDSIAPDPSRHALYRVLFENGYLTQQTVIRNL